MHLLFRTIAHLIRSRFRSRLAMTDVGRIELRVIPTDIDALRHMNNGVYFSIMDLGRIDLLIRAGAWSRLRAKGYYPVMVNETISFRRSLDLWQKFTLETRVAGVDDKAVFVEQRFVVDGEIHASAMTRARFLKRGGGVVPMAELLEVVGATGAEFELDKWVTRWARDVALPPSKASAPSDWPERG